MKFEHHISRGEADKSIIMRMRERMLKQVAAMTLRMLLISFLICQTIAALSKPTQDSHAHGLFHPDPRTGLAKPLIDPPVTSLVFI